jgi:hypothetical protein
MAVSKEVQNARYNKHYAANRDLINKKKILKRVREGASIQQKTLDRYEWSPEERAMLEQSMKNREKQKIENTVVSPDELITRPDGRSQKRTKKTNDTPPAQPPSTHEDEEAPEETNMENTCGNTRE